MRKVPYTLYREDSDYVAQCLDHDVSSFGASEADTYAELCGIILDETEHRSANVETLAAMNEPVDHPALEIEKALPAMEPEAARNFEMAGVRFFPVGLIRLGTNLAVRSSSTDKNHTQMAVRAMLSMTKRGNSGEASDFDRLLQEEEVLRETMRRGGRQFSGN